MSATGIRSEYGEKPEVIDRLKKQAVEELIDFLEARARPETFREVLDLLAGYGDAERDPQALPCPG